MSEVKEDHGGPDMAQQRHSCRCFGTEEPRDLTTVFIGLVGYHVENVLRG